MSKVHLRLAGGAIACGVDKSKRWTSYTISSLRILNIRCSHCMEPITCLSCRKVASK